MVSKKTEAATKGYRCARCDKTYTSMMRLLHHRAAEHAAKGLADIRTTKDIRHSTGS